MSELMPFIRPVIGLFLLLMGIDRLLRPRIVAARWAAEKERKRARAEKPGDVAPPPIVPPSERRVRLQGVAWTVVGLLLLWLSPIHLRLSFGQPVAAGENQMEASAIARTKGVEFVNEHAIPNLSLAVVSDGKQFVTGLGHRSLLSGQPVDGDTLFEIGSITKTFTGVLLARKIESGELKLDTPIASLLPPGAIPDGSQLAGITLRHLTTHSSGLPPMPPNYPSAGRIFRILSGLDPYRTYSDAELLEALPKTKLDAPPGAKGEYSNYGVSLLGWGLAEREGSTYEELVIRDVCRPLGMHDTTIHLNREQKGRLARGYDTTASLGPLRLARGAANWELPNAFAGAGGLRSSANDMLKYLKANMGRGTNAISSALAESHEDLFPFNERHHIGMNWLRRKPRDSTPSIIWHNGGTGGYRSFMGFSEDKRHGIVVLSGSDKSVDSLGFRILEALVKNSPPLETKSL